MSRKKRVLKRPSVQPDLVFGSVLVTRLVNRVMKDGKKTKAANIVYKALYQASENLQVEPLEVLEKAVENVKPKIEVKSMRVGGANYQVPMEPYPFRALSLSLRWIVNSSRGISGTSMANALRTVLEQSYNDEGPAIDIRKRVEQTAAGNKAFAHLAALARKK
jgi:small subunit ribosomal protein S7